MEENGGFLLHYCCSFNNSRNDLWVDHSIERPAGINDNKDIMPVMEMQSKHELYPLRQS